MGTMTDGSNASGEMGGKGAPAATRVTAATRGSRMPRTAQVADRLVFVDETASTNTLARHLVADGALDVTGPSSASGAAGSAATAPRVAVVATDRQTAGRGRLDHTWRSAPGESSTVTYVVAVPRALATDAAVNGWLQMIAGLATLDGIRAALADVGAGPLHAVGSGSADSSDSDSSDSMDAGDSMGAGDPDGSAVPAADRLGLKWPNDLFVGDFKLGGILAELVPLPAHVADTAADSADSVADVAAHPADSSDSDSSDPSASVAIVFGIGLNLAVPADRLPTAQSTSLQLHYGPLPSDDALRDRIAAATVVSLRRRLAAFVAEPHGTAAAARAEVVKVCVTLGRRAVAHFTDGSSLEGEAVALDDDASLTMRDASGVMHVVRTADVGVLPA